jgi:hypothetical protein
LSGEEELDQTVGPIARLAYKAERGGNELFWSPWTMYPRVRPESC